MRRFLATAALILSVGCAETTYGPTQYEPGEIVAMTYMPPGHGSGVGVAPVVGGNGGVGIAFVDVDIPARYGIVFRCNHGSFVINGGSRSTAAKLITDTALEAGMDVTIQYREVLEDGVFVDYDFMWATKR